MGKKKKSELDKQFAGFKAGMNERGYSDAAVDTLWDILLPFSDYAFNKAHSAAYGVLSYWTAYLKAHYPAEYMAALLTSVGDARDKLAVYLNECRRMKIQVLPPDVNESIGFFAAVGEDIRFGMGAIRNVGSNVVEQIIAARNEKGRFTSFHDFLRKVPLGVANKRTVESLIKAGAFDSLGSTRRSLLEIHEDAVDAGRQGQARRGERRLRVRLRQPVRRAAGDRRRSRPKPEWSQEAEARVRARDARALRLRPPAGRPGGGAREARVDSIGDLLALETPPDGEQVTLAGLVTEVQHRVARNSGNQYGIVQIEDFGGTVSVMFLGKAYQEFAPALVADSVVVVRGRVSARDDGMNIHANSLFAPDLGIERRRRTAHDHAARRAGDDRDRQVAVRRADPQLGRHRGAAPADEGRDRARLRDPVPGPGDGRPLRRAEEPPGPRLRP